MTKTGDLLLPERERERKGDIIGLWSEPVSATH